MFDVIQDKFDIAGTSQAVERIRDLAMKYSLEKEPILLRGETGVGKNHIAEQIHCYSGRKGRFVIVDTPNINDNLFESKLFGHKRGAFTDARFDKIGLVEEAAGGTLFFDEISEVPLDFQAKLLRFIDTRKYYTLGESTEKEADVRILAATNRDLHQAVEDQEFRSDLYYRLNVLEIEIPPLRERKEDIKNLVLENRVLLRGKEIGEGFWDVICNHRWPGNVRELITVLKRAGILLESPITGQALAKIIRDLNKKSPTNIEDKTEEVWKGIESGKDFWEMVWRPFIDREFDRSLVRQVLKKAFRAGLENFKKMNALLNIGESDYHKFMSLMHQYRIDPRE